MATVIVRDPETMHGIPVFRGTRVPVQTLFDYLEGGETLDEFLEGFPTVSRALALDALEEARTLLLMRLLIDESVDHSPRGHYSANRPSRLFHFALNAPTAVRRKSGALG